MTNPADFLITPPTEVVRERKPKRQATVTRIHPRSNPRMNEPKRDIPSEAYLFNMLTPSGKESFGHSAQEVAMLQKLGWELLP